MAVDLVDLLHRRGLDQHRGQTLLHGQDHALRGGDADGGRAQLDGLDGVLHLEQAALGREGVDAAVVVTASLVHITRIGKMDLLLSY